MLWQRWLQALCSTEKALASQELCLPALQQVLWQLSSSPQCSASGRPGCSEPGGPAFCSVPSRQPHADDTDKALGDCRTTSRNTPGFFSHLWKRAIWQPGTPILTAAWLRNKLLCKATEMLKPLFVIVASITLTNINMLCDNYYTNNGEGVTCCIKLAVINDITHEKMFSIISHQENTNQNHNEMPLHFH